MALIAMQGPRKKVNNALMFHALQHAPSVIIDCANRANIHPFFPFTHPDAFAHTYVIPVDLIYCFRDVLRSLPKTARQLNANSIVITTFSSLFNYQDDEENYFIFEHAWELMKSLSRDFEVIVGLPSSPMHLAFARRLCDEIRGEDVSGCVTKEG